MKLKKNYIIYDFDKTIYNGDSSIDFFKFGIKKNKFNIRYIPVSIILYMLSKINLVSVEKVKSYFFKFVKNINDIDKFMEEYRVLHMKNIFQWYIEKRKTINKSETVEIVITASPEFIVEVFTKYLEIDHVIGTKYDLKKGKVIGKNCRNKEKVIRLKNEYPEANNILEFFSDDYIDQPLSELSQKSILIDNGVLKKW